MTDHLNQPPDSSTDQNKYAIRSRMEITHILGSLGKFGASVNAYLGGIGDDFILTSILAVLPEQNKVLLDFGANAEANKRALSARKIVCVTALDRIRIQMSVESFQVARFEGREVFVMTIPESLTRLQRRENYRIKTPRGNPLMCLIDPSQVLPGVPDEMTIVDISCGGIALALPAEADGIETGMRFNRCRIPLPELAEATNFGALYENSRHLGLPEVIEVTTDLMVRGTFDIRFSNGVMSRHAGCEFMGMRERERALIQRYISKSERERRYRAAGH